MPVTTKTLVTSFPGIVATGLPFYTVTAPNGTVLVPRSNAGVVALPNGAFAASAAWDDASDAIESWDWSGNVSPPRLWDRRLSFMPSVATLLALVQGSGGSIPSGAAVISDPQSATANVAWYRRFVGIGFDSTGWTKFTFTIKANKDSDLDAAALAIIRVSNPAAPDTDGLLLWKGQPVPSAHLFRNSADIGITLAGADTILNVSLGADVLALDPSEPSAPYSYEIDRWDANGRKEQIGMGDFSLARNVLRGITAP